MGQSKSRGEFSIFVKNSQLGEGSSTLAAPLLCSCIYSHSIFLFIKGMRRVFLKTLNGKKK